MCHIVHRVLAPRFGVVGGVDAGQQAVMMAAVVVVMVEVVVVAASGHHRHNCL